MKDEIFIIVQNLKKSIAKWRVFSIISIFLIIIASTNEKMFHTENKENSIFKITIDRVIENNMFSEEKLEYILNNDYIKGVIFECNSPGGDVVESEKIYNILRKIAIKKPMIVTINGLCTSGAYMMAMASDYIISYNTSLIGSIGVVVEAFEITELAKKIGINLTNYKSSSLKSPLNPFEKISPDVDMVISQQINDIYDYFLNIFIDRRKIKVNEAQEIANGQAYTGRQALDFGLVDKIGGTDEMREFFKINNIDLKKVKIVNFDIYNDDKKINFFKNINKSIENFNKMKLSLKTILQ